SPGKPARNLDPHATCRHWAHGQLLRPGPIRRTIPPRLQRQRVEGGRAIGPCAVVTPTRQTCVGGDAWRTLFSPVKLLFSVGRSCRLADPCAEPCHAGLPVFYAACQHLAISRYGWSLTGRSRLNCICSLTVRG